MIKLTIFTILLLCFNSFADELPTDIKNLEKTYYTQSEDSSLIFKIINKRSSFVTRRLAKKILKKSKENMGNSYRNLYIEKLSFNFNPIKMYQNESWFNLVSNSHDIQKNILQLLQWADDGIGVNILDFDSGDPLRNSYFKDAFLGKRTTHFRAFELTNGDVMHGNMVIAIRTSLNGKKNELIAVVVGTN